MNQIDMLKYDIQINSWYWLTVARNIITSNKDNRESIYQLAEAIKHCYQIPGKTYYDYVPVAIYLYKLYRYN